MATYGRGQMLGSGINPESFKQDYSGFTRAAEIQAQGVSNLGASIGGVIKDFGEARKEQKKVEASNKASVKAIEAAITLGGSYGVSGVEETLRPFLDAYNDANLSSIEKAALLDEGKGMIPNVFGRFDAREADAIKRAQIDARNEPPMPTPLTYKRATNVPYGGGFLDDLLIGSDGEYYDEARNLVADMGAFARGESPEVYSGYSTFSDDLGSMTTPPVFMPGENPAANIDYASNLKTSSQTTGFPTNLNVPSFAPSIDAGRINAGRIDAVLDGGVLPPKQEIPQLERELGIDANERQNIQSRIRFDADKAEEEPVIITAEKLSELVAMGVRPKGSLNPDGTFSVTDFNTGSLQQGMTIESDGQGGVKIVQGALGKKELTEEQKKNTIRLRSQASANILRDIDTAIELIGESGGPLQRTAMAIYPGSAANALKKVLASLESSFAIEQLMTLRATGTTLGQVPQSQAEMLAQLMGPLGSEDAIGLRDDVLLKTLIDARQSYGALLNETMEAIPKNLRSDVDIVNRMLKGYRKERNLDGNDNKVPASGIPRSEEIEAIRKKYLTPPAQ